MSASCLECAKAEWQRTKSGSLHPSGAGRCRWQFRSPAIPKAFYYWGVEKREAPSPHGGHISRKTPHTDCPLFHAKEATP